MEIFSVNDEKFRKYGKVWNNIECTKLIKGMEHTPLPEDVIYVPSQIMEVVTPSLAGEIIPESTAPIKSL